MKKSFWYGLLAATVFITDRVTKYYAVKQCVDPFIINTYLTCSLSFNRGVTWSLFHSPQAAIFYGVTFMITLITLGVAWYAYQRFMQGYTIIGELMIVAGSCSNIVDRFWFGGVVDFIELSYGDWHWPSFNVADICIVTGVFCMLYFYHKEENEI